MPGRVTSLPALLHSFQHSVFLGVDDMTEASKNWPGFNPALKSLVDGIKTISRKMPVGLCSSHGPVSPHNQTPRSAAKI
jgi:hypothetical protein